MSTPTRQRPWVPPFLAGLGTAWAVSFAGTRWLGWPTPWWSLVVAIAVGGVVLLALDLIYRQGRENHR